MQPESYNADPGLVRLLQELKDDDVLLAIGTTATKQSADIKLKILGIRRFFDSIPTAEDIKHHKPDPEVYLRAPVRLGVAANKAPLSGTIRTIQNWQAISYDQLVALM